MIVKVQLSWGAKSGDVIALITDEAGEIRIQRGASHYDLSVMAGVSKGYCSAGWRNGQLVLLHRLKDKGRDW